MPNAEVKLPIVEDDVPIRKLLSVILAESGYRVRSAEDGFSALVEIRNEIPDIILSDLNMPGMSGFELLSVVRCRFPAPKSTLSFMKAIAETDHAGTIAEAKEDKK